MKKMPWYRRIPVGTRIALGTALIAILCWLVLAVYSVLATNILLQDSSEGIFHSASDAVTKELRSTYAPVRQATQMLAYSRLAESQGVPERLALLPWLIELLEDMPAAAGIQLGNDSGDYFIVRALNTERVRMRFAAPKGAAFNVDNLNGQTGEYQRWFFDVQGQLISEIALPETDYDPRARPWYVQAQAQRNTQTTDPYVFFFMQEMGLTLSHISADGEAVVAIDITLHSITESLRQQKDLLSADSVIHINGKVLAASVEQNTLVPDGSGSLRQITLDELDNPVFAVAAAAQNQALPGWLVSKTPLQLSGESSAELLLAIHENQLLSEFKSMRQQMLWITFVILLVLVLLSAVLARRISTPLKQLAVAIGDIGQGKLDFQLPPIRYDDEVAALNTALSTMQQSLDYHIEKLAEEHGARERMQGELDVARRIQMNMVPGAGRLNLQLGRCDICAIMEPARAVGGDLYQVTEMADGRLFIAVGDVSDKGAPAALFMSRTQTLLSMLVDRTANVSELLVQLNNELVEHNDACMFTTLFCGFYNPASGELNYACAGHTPPILQTATGVRSVPMEYDGAPLGVFEDQHYPGAQLQLAVADRLVIYTDGITEAFDHERNEYGEERLLDAVKSAGGEINCYQFSETLLKHVADFVNGADQSDDITLLVMERL